MRSTRGCVLVHLDDEAVWNIRNILASVVFSIRRALFRSRIAILTVGLTYLISVAVGMIMVHTGNQFALDFRDSIVSNAQSSPIIVALDQNNRLLAALLDTGGNLIGAVSNTLGGLGVVFPYPFIAYRGWIGGIVSIDGAHISRLADPNEAFYYLSTLILQLIPSILAAGAGVNLGLNFYRPKPYYEGKKFLGTIGGGDPGCVVDLRSRDPAAADRLPVGIRDEVTLCGICLGWSGYYVIHPISPPPARRGVRPYAPTGRSPPPFP